MKQSLSIKETSDTELEGKKKKAIILAFLNAVTPLYLKPF